MAKNLIKKKEKDKPLNEAVESVEARFLCQFDNAIYKGIAGIIKKLLHNK